MGLSQPFASAVLGTFAVSTTATLLALNIVLALRCSNPTSSTRITAIISSVLQLAVLALLSWILFASIKRETKIVTGLFFGSGIVLCAIAGALTVATLICLSSSAALGSTTLGFVAGISIALVASFVTQLLFLVARFIIDRPQDESRTKSPNMQEVGWRFPTTRVKTIPYSSTSTPEPATRNVSMESKYPPSAGGFSAAETFSSMASSLTNIVRPMSSRTRLLSSSHNSLRSDTFSRRDRRSTSEDFDSWDVSSVDPQNRQTVLESSSPITGGHFLETIPASPTTSRSPSPGTTLDLDVARQRRRSRSYSPTSMRTPLQPPQRAFTQQVSVSESHIHPLFRSDSPVPPPLATPGTVVIAAPQAGQIISDRESIRSLGRIRSGSLPVAPRPLTRTGSTDTFAHRNGSFDTFGHLNKTSFSVGSDGGRSSDEAGQERKITPPVPDYILNAGSTTSLHSHKVRKMHSREGPSGPGLDALPGGAGW
ncbi:hypothetical protein VM1G_00253 [Cytospora mali]|uniref:Uncharacterized protein n=1 Tax=Cytospora mali TaxID=578113 RepID=A0A194VL65_CYTMA|nr:hypothetical protein VM1G_00253 [Valsa mali]